MQPCLAVLALGMLRGGDPHNHVLLWDAHGVLGFFGGFLVLLLTLTSFGFIALKSQPCKKTKTNKQINKNKAKGKTEQSAFGQSSGAFGVGLG